MGVYSIAIQIANLQEVFKEYGLDPHIIQLATDTIESPITKELAENPAIKIIDYTGSSSFGNYIESLPGKVTFTEKAGVNTVILDSVTDLGKVAQNLAFSFSLYSGQMCTAPQNVFIPKEGIKGPEGVISYDEVVNALTTAIKGLSGHPKAGPGICGAIQNPATLERIDKAKSMGSRVLLESAAIANPDFPNARTASPLVIEVPANKPEVFEQELFGPIVLIIPTDSTDQSIALAQSMAQKHGAISCAAYTTNADTQEKIAEAMADAYTPTAFNLMGQVFVNQNAAFSDPHVSGGNPAGNASFTNDEFVAKRYTVVEFKVEPTQA
jgi:phenylacetic acid degradation protein paaN